MTCGPTTGKCRNWTPQSQTGVCRFTMLQSSILPPSSLRSSFKGGNAAAIPGIHPTQPTHVLSMSQFLMFLDRRWSLHYKSDLTTIYSRTSRRLGFSHPSCSLLDKSAFTWKGWNAKPSSFQNSSVPHEWLGNGCRMLGPQATQGLPREDWMSTGRRWTALFPPFSSLPRWQPRKLEMSTKQVSVA